MSGRFEGAAVMITGAGSGVGRATAVAFADEGASVTCADLRADWAAATVTRIESAGGRARAVACDVADEASVEAAIGSVVEADGRLDVIVNNAGVSTPRAGMKVEDHTGADVARLLAINFLGVFHGCKHAVVAFKRQGGGGVIVNTGSAAGLVGWGGTVYGATKGAVHQLTRSVAIEGAPYGIRANAICPGGMPSTNFLVPGADAGSEGTAADVAEAVAAMHPLGNAITAEDCATAILYLASPDAKNVTGALLPVDGGYVAR